LAAGPFAAIATVRSFQGAQNQSRPPGRHLQQPAHRRRRHRHYVSLQRLPDRGDHAHLADKAAFKAYLAPLHRTKWFVYCKRPFAGPEQVLAYLSRYTHRVAISNSRLIAADATGVTFRYKDYRIKGPGRYKTMTIKPGEFIRRFLIHVLPNGFHRIRHYGLLASGTKAQTIARARELIAAAKPAQTAQKQQAPDCACGNRLTSTRLFFSIVEKCLAFATDRKNRPLLLEGAFAQIAEHAGRIAELR
jgi:hypothetical protein